MRRDAKTGTLYITELLTGRIVALEPRQPAKAPEIERATLRPGCLVAVLDVSANGAQVQSERPLRPGSRVHARLAAPGNGSGELIVMKGESDTADRPRYTGAF